MSGMNLYSSDKCQDAKNVYYPQCVRIDTLNDLLNAVKFDHISAKMKNDRRSEENFIECDCIQVDCDNTHTEEPADWVTVDDITDAFPDVEFYYIHSRNHMKVKTKTNKKNGEIINYEARPKFHVYFPLKETITDRSAAYDLLNGILACFPYFDAAAAKPEQLFFGVEAPTGGYVEGELAIDDFIAGVTVDEMKSSVEAYVSKISPGDDVRRDEVQKGLSRLRGFLGLEDDTGRGLQVILDYGTGDIPEDGQLEGLKWFTSWAWYHDIKLGTRYEIKTGSHKGALAICVACPWEDEHSGGDYPENECVIIIDQTGKLNFLCRHNHNGKSYGWKDYRAYYEGKSAAAVTQNTQTTKQPDSLKLEEYSDVNQAALFVREYGNIVRYTKATHFLCFTGKVWEESDLKVQRLSQRLTTRQLKEAKQMVIQAVRKVNEAKEKLDSTAEKIAEAEQAKAEYYRDSVIRRRNSQKIKATMTEVQPLVEIGVDTLDQNGFLLNTPGGTVDLRTGQIKPNDPKDYCTKITSVAPGTENADVFDAFLDQITVNDADLKWYLQEIAGAFALGYVKREELYIVIGGGGNGKSTYFNLLFKVFGDYAGMVSSEALVTSTKNKDPELAELRGKRFILAAELEEGRRLDTGMIKKLSSTDPIQAAKKFKDPFYFSPSHSTVLYTNHLPKVGARDGGTWDRLVIIPFNARFRNTQNEVKDYASVLYEKCGGAVLTWIIEGARRYIQNNYRISQPECVKKAIADYKNSNDWLADFISECCEVGPGLKESAGRLYEGYRAYCLSIGEYTRNKPDFKDAMISAGFKWQKFKTGAVWYGISYNIGAHILRNRAEALDEATRQEIEQKHA